MRKIIFRGKSIYTNKWVYGNLRIFGEKVYISAIDCHAQSEVHLSTIGQYTGLKDKNGVEIYEGDIVTIKGAVSATVEWNNFGFHLYGLEDVSGRRPDYAFSDFNQIEVIGNIHERKEI